MKPSRWCVVFLMFLFTTQSIFSQGETGAQFLKIGVGAKACAMGEAFTSIADDPSAIYWNPAGISQLNSTQLQAMQNFWIFEMSSQYGALILPFEFGTLGISFSYSSSGDITKFENFVQVGEYNAYDMAGTVTYAYKVNEIISMGAGIKYISQSIENESSNGYALDIGVLSKINALGNFKVGLSILNIGPSIKFIRESDPLPLNIRSGVSYNISIITLACEVYKPRELDYYFASGFDLQIIDEFFLRAGYNTKNSYSLGAGINIESVFFDYAFVPYNDINDTHRISLGVLFN